MLLLWNLLLALGWPLLYLYRPFRGTIPQRLGRGLPEWGSRDAAEQRPRAIHRIAPTGDEPRHCTPTFLINAVSAGEVAAVAPFIRELKQRRPGCRIALLTTTDSGLEMARRRLGNDVDLTAYFPLLDLPWVSRRYLDRLRPDIYITTESELWPNIQQHCRARGIPVVSLNARLYLHNKRGLRGALIRRLYALVDLIVCQSEQQHANFVRFGIPPAKLAVSGNLKFDTDIPAWAAAQDTAWRAELGLPTAARCIVAGSIHPVEDGLLLDAFVNLLETGNQSVALSLERPRLIIAPRHIERAPDLVAAAVKRGFRTARLSEVTADDWQVLVVDRYGVLVDLYRVANVVILGGTFDPKVGGHNVLEATALGKPVMVGPHTYSIAAQLETLDAVDGLVHSPATVPGLLAALSGLLGNPSRAATVGAHARDVTLASRGAAGRAAEIVLAKLNAR